MSDSDRPKPSQRRPSLKELAERVSKTPPPSSVSPASVRPSAPPAPPSSLSAVATPPPSSLRTPIPAAAPSPARSSAPPSAAAPVSTPPSQERASAPPSAAPASAPPAAKDSAPKAAAAVVPIAKAKSEEKSGGGMGGLLIAGLGLAAAAALFFFLRSGDDAAKKQAKEETPVATTTVVVTATAEPTQAAVVETAKPEEPKKDDTLDLEDLAEASSSASASALPGGPLPPGSAVAVNDAKDPKQPFVPNPDGTLDDAMRKAAGDPSAKKDETPQPASEDKGPKNVPDQPPVGSVNAYVAAARSAAKGCVAGADAPTTATVTFGSNGAVSKVSVGGWAAGKPAASCVDGAMRGKGVEAFSKPSYSVTVTVRP